MMNKEVASDVATVPVKSIGEMWKEAFDLDKDTLRQLSHSKRFLERWIADESFKNGLLSGELSLTDAQALCGCEIDVETLQPVFHPDFYAFRPEASEAGWPLTHLWDQHLGRLLRIRDAIPAHGSSSGLTPEFDVWRNRNMNRASLQLDVAAGGITHPPVAFELSSGCSVGCWFCGISAEKFRGHASLADGGDVEWQKTVEAVQSIVGKGIQCGFCYWATDPLDNPEYLGFLEIYERVTGCIPQTTTAIALRNVELTRSVLRLWNHRKSTPNRFSVMTKRQLLEIHETFTPEELFGCEIVLQTGSAGAVTKFAAGRNFEKLSNKEAALAGSIACVTGFLINIVEKTIKLISPTMPSKEWPNGYIVFASETYRNAEHLKEVLDGMIGTSVRAHMAGSRPVRIADGGIYDRKRDAEAIMFRRIEISNEFIRFAGDHLVDGRSTPLSITGSCIKQGIEPLVAIAALEKMWQEGVLAQDAVY
jgi:radical SAM family RiPP maturation amino acid epimerase